MISQEIVMALLQIPTGGSCALLGCSSAADNRGQPRSTRGREVMYLNGVALIKQHKDVVDLLYHGGIAVVWNVWRGDWRERGESSQSEAIRGLFS